MMSSSIKKYASNVSWVMAERILRMVAGLFVGLYVARFLGPGSFGLLSFVNSITAIMGEVGRLGLDSICIREYLKSPEDEKAKILGSVFHLKIIGSLAAYLATIALIFILDMEGITRFYIAIISIGFVFQGSEVVDYYFQAEVRSKFVSICRIGQLIFASAAKLIAIYLGMGLLTFVWITLFEQIVLSLLLVFIYKYQGKFHFWRTFDRGVMLSLLKDSWPLFVSAMVTCLYMRVDQVMLKTMLGNQEVGIYTAAMRISEIWYFIPMTLYSTLFPTIVASRNHSEEKFNRRIQGLFDLMLWISLVPIVVVTFGSIQIVHLLYGNAYAASAEILVITIWAGLPVAMGISRSVWIMAQNLQRTIFLFAFVGVISKFALNFILIPRWGIMGAGWATLLSQASVAFVAPLMFKETRPIASIFMRSFNLIGSCKRILKGDWR